MPTASGGSSWSAASRSETRLATCLAAVPSVSSNSMENSSPPNRAALSMFRHQPCRTAPRRPSARDCNSSNHEDGRRCLAWAKPECRPDQEGDAEKLQGIVPDARRKEPTEHVLADEEYAREQNDSLCKLRSVPSKTWIPEPENK